MSDAALRTAQRALHEKEAVRRRLAPAQETVMPEVARDALRKANAMADLCSAVRRLTKSAPGAEGVE